MNKIISITVEPYMYTATLDNGDTIIALENGTARNQSGDIYNIVSHVDENDEIIVDGFKPAK